MVTVSPMAGMCVVSAIVVGVRVVVAVSADVFVMVGVVVLVVVIGSRWRAGGGATRLGRWGWVVVVSHGVTSSVGGAGCGLEGAQAEAVADHEDAGEGHGGSGDRRVEQAERGQRDGGNVVGERPEQVALEGGQGPAGEPDGVDGGAEVTADQGEGSQTAEG